MKKESIIKRGKRLIKRRGIKGVLEKLLSKGHFINEKTDLLLSLQFLTDNEEIPLNRNEQRIQQKENVILLNWVIPEMGKGSGGHLNIFRMVSYLEKMGFHSRIYLYMSPNYENNESVVEFVREYFPILDHKVELFWDVSFMTYANITFATSWETAYYVKRFKNTGAQCYFVQDFEPFFFPKGSYYHLAENTYSFGFYGITAGDWLKNKLAKEYGMWTRSFGFSYDKEIYQPKIKTGVTKRIFFYARPYTPRRDFEIGLLALNEVCNCLKDITVVFAGEDLSAYVIPFKHENRGILALEELAEFYAGCDMCIVISSTNLSLLPLEIMGSNSVPVCSKGENSEWLVNEENAIMVDYNPVSIANKILYYYTHIEELEDIRRKGVAFAQSTAWEHEANKIKDALNEIIEISNEDNDKE